MKKNGFLLILMTALITQTVTADTSQIEEAFTKIYASAEWGKDNEGNGTSGSGATIEEAEAYMSFLQTFLRENDIKSVIDVGCGDWQFSRYIDWSGIQYTGYDIVKNVVDRNNENFASGNISFVHGDGTLLDLPEADLLVCKDVLQHLSIPKIQLFLKQLHKYRYCLLTNDISDSPKKNNRPCRDGGYRNIDLKAPPFNCPGVPIFHYTSGTTFKQVYLVKPTIVSDGV